VLWPYDLGFMAPKTSTLFDSHKFLLAMQSLLIPLMKWLHNFLHGFEHMGRENIIITKVRLTFKILKVIVGEGFG
jgi:hypothetical protein